MSDDDAMTPVQRDTLRAVADLEPAAEYDVKRWVEMLYDAVIDAEEVASDLDALASRGLVERERGAYRLTDDGRAVVEDDE